MLVTRLCVSVCMPFAAFPHYSLAYCTDPDNLDKWYGVSPSCARLGRFAIATRVSLLWQHSANAKCQRVLVLTLCLVLSQWRQRNAVVSCAIIACNALQFLHALIAGFQTCWKIWCKMLQPMTAFDGITWRDVVLCVAVGTRDASIIV